MSIKKFVCLLVIFGLLAVTFASGDSPSAAPASDTPNADAPSADSQSPSAGGSPSAEGSSNSTSTEVERNFDFNFGSEQIEARIRIREGASESEVRHELRATSSGAEFRVEFEQKAGDTENQLRLRLRLFELIEYVPDQTPGYQNETIVNTYNTWNWGKGFVDSTAAQTNDSREFTLTTADGIFTVVIRINRPVEGNLTVNPEDVKFDIQLDTAAMRAAGWLNGTEVALNAALVSRLETEQRQEGSDEHAIALGSAGASQFGALAVSWINYIQCGITKVSIVPSLRVDNNQTSVEDGDDADSTGHVVSFAFVDLAAADSSTCIWDPILGANRATASAGTPSSPTTSPTTTNPTTGVPTARSSSAASVVASLAILTTALVALF